MTNSLNIDLSPYLEWPKLYVAYSGGIDSTVLLHLFASDKRLKDKITAIHINHQLHEQANRWQIHCETVCKQWGVPLVVEQLDLKGITSNIEENARNARYKAIEKIADKDGLTLLGHHLNDQAETVMLALSRGTGLTGLCGMKSTIQRGCHHFNRPLISTNKDALEAYATIHGLRAIHDDSNNDTRFRRNFFRHEMLPLMETKYPAIQQTLVRNAEVLSDINAVLNEHLSPLFEPCLNPDGSLNLVELQQHSPPYQRLLLRTWLKRFSLTASSEFLNRVIAEVILARTDRNPLISLKEMVLARFRQSLHVVPKKHLSKPLPNDTEWDDIHSPIQFASYQLSLSKDKQGESAINIPCGAKIELRKRQGGEKIYLNGQHKSLKKLFQYWSIPPWVRRQLPLLFINGELAAIPSLAISDHYAKPLHSGYYLAVNSC